MHIPRLTCRAKKHGRRWISDEERLVNILRYVFDAIPLPSFFISSAFEHDHVLMNRFHSPCSFSFLFFSLLPRLGRRLYFTGEKCRSLNGILHHVPQGGITRTIRKVNPSHHPREKRVAAGHIKPWSGEITQHITKA